MVTSPVNLAQIALSLRAAHGSLHTAPWVWDAGIPNQIITGHLEGERLRWFGNMRTYSTDLRAPFPTGGTVCVRVCLWCREVRIVMVRW